MSDKTGNWLLAVGLAIMVFIGIRNAVLAASVTVGWEYFGYAFIATLAFTFVVHSFVEIFEGRKK